MLDGIVSSVDIVEIERCDDTGRIRGWIVGESASRGLRASTADLASPLYNLRPQLTEVFYLEDDLVSWLQVSSVVFQQTSRSHRSACDDVAG